MTKKKSSFGRFIFILLLLIILAAGGFLGYKYYSEGKENSVSTIKLDGEIKFPIAGTWYVNDSGEEYQDNALNFSEYTFETPAKVDGKLTGKINTVAFKDGNPVRTGSYEIVGENKLIISFPQEMDYDFTYTYYPDEQKLDMDFAGQKRTLTRTNPVAQNTAPAKEALPETEEEKQIRLWMENIEGDWEDSLKTNPLFRFGKPTKEGNVITGEFHGIYSNDLTYIYKYERSSGGRTNFKGVKAIRKGVEDPYERVLKWKVQFNDEGNGFSLNDSPTLRHKLVK